MERPIGIFDSGLGGLTVVRAVRRRLPAEAIVYFGDTARVPYGIKSGATITRFAVEDCEFLCRWDPKFIMVACNTASAAALGTLRTQFSVPVAGVIEPGARAAARVAGDRPIGVIGTEATIGSGAYRDAIRRLRPGVRIVERACPLLVSLVEEGRQSGDPIVRAVLEEYLGPMREAGIGSLVLGCTHYPLLKEAMVDVLGPEVVLVDSADAAAEEMEETLGRAGLLRRGGGTGTIEFFVSDNPERCREVGRRFLGEAIERVSLISPECFFGGGPAAPVKGGIVQTAKGE